MGIFYEAVFLGMLCTYAYIKDVFNDSSGCVCAYIQPAFVSDFGGRFGPGFIIRLFADDVYNA